MTISEFFTVRGVPAEVKDEFKLACLKRKERIGAAIASLMIDYVAQSGFESPLWKGFARAKWSDVKPGQEVWIAGAEAGKPSAYGPHTVVEPKGRVLCNKLGTNFYQYQDVLLRRLK